MTSAARPIRATGYLAAARRAVPHGAALSYFIVGSVIVGRPEGWLAFFLPLSTLLVGRLLNRDDDHADRAYREALAFAIVVAAMIGGAWAMLTLPQHVSLAVALVPVALLLLLLGAVNFVAVSISRTLRAWRNQAVEYPWIPGVLARRLGLERTPAYAPGPHTTEDTSLSSLHEKRSQRWRPLNSTD